MPKSIKIELSSAIILVGFFSAVFFHYCKAAYFHKGYPLNTFLFSPYRQQFSDFYSDYLSAKNLSPYTSAHISAYFPAAYLLFYPFTMFEKHFGAYFYSGFFALVLMQFCIYYLRRDSEIAIDGNENIFLNIKNIFIFSFMTFPILFAFERGNLEFMLFVFLALSLFFYVRKKYILSALLLSAPIAMKIYPMVFLVLFLSDKHYKEIFICLFSAAFLTLGSLLIFTGSISDQLSSMGLAFQGFRDFYLYGTSGLQFNLSYFTLGETLFRKWYSFGWYSSLSISDAVLKNYALTVMLFFVLISLYIILFEKTFWKKVALLVCSMLLFPYVSYDYKLLYIYLPFFFFVNSAPQKFGCDLKYVCIFSLLFIPKNYFLIYGDLSVASFIDVILLSGLMVSIFCDAFLSESKTNHFPPRN